MARIFLLDRPDPDWGVIESARAVRSTDTDVSLVDVAVVNFGKTPLILNELSISASHHAIRPVGMGCATEDPEVPTVLNWRRIIETDGKEGVRTRLGSVDIPVPARYRGAGMCSNYAFSAGIPIGESVAPGRAIYLRVKLRELPSFQRSPAIQGLFGIRPSDLTSLAGAAPASVLDWNSVLVGFGEESGVFPKKISLKKHGDAD
jgi:hypothetical protein